MKLKVPQGCGGVSHQGVEYPAVKGVVEVPETAMVFLEPGYGCTLITEAAPEPEAPKKGAKEKTED